MSSHIGVQFALVCLEKTNSCCLFLMKPLKFFVWPRIGLALSFRFYLLNQ